MDKIQFEKVLKPLLEIYGQIERDIINNIASKFLNYSSIDGTLEWYLEKLKDLGTIDNETLSFIKKNKKDILKILRNITNSGTTVDNIEVLSNYYEKGLIDVNPFLLNKSTSISNLVSEALKDCTDITNLIDSKVLEGTEAAYKNIINKAYIETASGVYTYQESIRRALKEFAKEGIKTVHYASGKTLGIESVVRRDVVTRVNKLIGDSTIEHCKSLNTNMVYVDQHYGARVRTTYMQNDYEAHAEWQGKKYLIEGSSDKYKNLYEATGYGEMLGLKGINCYHNFRPTWEWEEIPKQIDEKQNKEEYELLQKQRTYERKIRRLKREKGIAKDFYSKEEQKALNERYKAVNEDFDSFLDSNNLTRDYSREYTNNDIKIKKEKINSYVDITEEIIRKAKKNPDKPIDIFELKIKDKDGNEIIYTTENALFDTKGPNTEEIESIERLRKIFGWDIGMIRRINEPSGIRTPDIQNMYTKEYWDIKGIHKSKTEKSKAKKISRAFDEAKNQTTNIVIDLNRKDCDLTNEEALQQIITALNRQKYEWIEQVILLGKEEFIKYYKKT